MNDREAMTSPDDTAVEETEVSTTEGPDPVAVLFESLKRQALEDAQQNGTENVMSDHELSEIAQVAYNASRETIARGNLSVENMTLSYAITVHGILSRDLAD